jgi:tRNA/tmRNA/rRNA uracil-C5-methylase (TrmA/RlmC/RlmD family)
VTASDVDEWADQVAELSVGAVAQGGHRVARDNGRPVVFVRHALPGERVRAVVTERHKGHLRAVRCGCQGNHTVNRCGAWLH